MLSLLYFFLCLSLLPYRLSSLNENIKNVIERGLDESMVARMLDRVDQNFLNISNDDIWSKIPSINPKAPFFFFHQRKAGGEGLRRSLFAVAEKHGLKSYVICEGNDPHNGARIACDTYHIGFGMSDVSLYAGHISYGEQYVIQRSDSGRRNRRSISCVTNFREPVSRVLSCLRFRHNVPCLATISVEQLEEYIHRPDSYGQSCLSEPFRIMSGIEDEDLLDFGIEEKGKRLRNRVRRRRLVEIDALDIYKRTLTHVAECAPVVLEIPKSFDLVADRYPQLFRDQETGANVGIDLINIHPTNRKNTIDKCAPSKKQMELLLNATWLERRLYDVVHQKVEAAANNALSLLIYAQKSASTPTDRNASLFNASTPADRNMSIANATTPTDHNLSFVNASISTDRNMSIVNSDKSG